MKEQEILQTIMRDMNTGWWEADMSRRIIRLSDFLQNLLQFPAPEIGFDEFKSHIPEPYLRYSGSALNARFKCFSTVFFESCKFSAISVFDNPSLRLIR